MGPAWLRLRGARPCAPPVSWCAYDLALDSPKALTPLGREASRRPRKPAEPGAPPPRPATTAALLAAIAALPPAAADVPLDPPPLVVLSLATRTVMDPKRHVHEVVAVR